MVGLVFKHTLTYREKATPRKALDSRRATSRALPRELPACIRLRAHRCTRAYGQVSRCSLSVSSTARRQPSSASMRAMVRPMPAEAPVTRATLPVSSRSISMPLPPQAVGAWPRRAQKERPPRSAPERPLPPFRGAAGLSPPAPSPSPCAGWAASSQAGRRRRWPAAPR